MRCEDVHTELADYLAGRSAAAAEVAAHLRSCPACQAEVEGLDDTWRLLGSVPAEQLDSARLRARFDESVAEYAGDQRSGSDTGWPASRRAWPISRSFAQGALAAAAALILGVVLGRQTSAPPAPATDPQIAGLRQELHDMRQMVTLSLLQQQSASDRLKGVTFTGRLDSPDNEVVTALVDTLMHDANVNVRLASIDALKRFAEHDVVRRGTVDALTRQTSPLVQIALIDYLIEMQGRESADAIRRLSQDPMVDETVRARATWALGKVG
jgi:hypothetical protein